MIATGGCGGTETPTYRAGGIVTYGDGQPLGGGWVEFQPVDSTTHLGARGPILPDGTFELGTFKAGDGAIEGEHRALISPPRPAVGLDKPLPASIDPRYQNFETSGLRFNVTRKPSQNRFTIQVERPKR